MHIHRIFGASYRLALLIPVSILANVACDGQPFGALTDPLTGGDVAGSLKDDGDNSAFERAQAATLDAGQSITISGEIESSDDVDLYSLGAVNAGDRITVDVKGDGGFNTVAAIFDSGNDLIDANDDRSYYSGQIDPYISKVIRRDETNVYVGITVSSATHFGSSEGQYNSGTYSITLKRESGGIIQEVRRQIVYLDFEGGAQVQIGSEPLTTMQPFSAEAISGRLAGKTEFLIGRCVEHLLTDYAAYDIEILSSRDYDKPSEPHSTLYFGNYHSSYLGLADNVDTYNVYLEQDAIIYTEDISMFESLQPNDEEVALCIANIAAHELGHLLGLEHSRDQLDCMATAATARQIIENDLTFRRSLLQADVFPIGFQNEPKVLMRNVGENPVAAEVQAEAAPKSSGGIWREKIGLPDIAISVCGRCGHAE